MPSIIWTYNAGFYSGQTSYLNMKVPTIAKDEKIELVMVKNVDTSVTYTGIEHVTSHMRKNCYRSRCEG